MKKILSISILLLVACFSAIAGNIVYPWRSTTAIVKSGQTFEVWFNASTGQTVNSIQLKGAYNTVNVTMSTVNGNWTYDPLSGNTYNRRITVTVPASAPADRYDLVLNTSTGTETSAGGVKVIQDYKSDYYIMHWSDGHFYQNGYDTDVLLKRKDMMIEIANIIDAEIIIETGDNMYNVRNHPEREVAYFIGESTLGTKGITKANAATFLTPGDHDAFRGNEWQQGTVLENADFFNDYWGVQKHNFKYGNARFMNVNNSWGLSATSNGVYQYQVNEAQAWLNGAGAGGNFFVTAGHNYDRMHKFINDFQPLNLALAGDKHHTANLNAQEITPGGPRISHIANSIANHFEYNLYKIDNISGTYTKPSGTTARVEVLNSGDQNIPSTWVTNLKLTYANANAGIATSNTATFVNKLAFAIANAKVRFVVPKGNTYTVTGGTITQEFNGTNYYIVDVATNLNANSTKNVSINKVATTIAVTGVTLTPSTAALTVGASQQLTATIAPTNATNQTVTWSTSNSSVATVNANGLVTAVGPGTATITVTTQNGGKTDTSVITVTAVSGGSQTYQAEDATYSGAVVATNQTGYNGTGFIDFVNNSGDYVQWTVNAPTAGEYDLSFRYALPNGDRPLELKVNGTVKVASLNFPATSVWDNWQTLTSTQTLNAGSNTIRLTTNGSNGGNIDELTVLAKVTGVTLTPSTATLSVGNTQQLTATVAPTNAANNTVTWSTSNASVATVNSSGLVTAVASGTATITVTTQDGGKTDISVITVNAVTTGSQTYQAEDGTYVGAVVATNQTGYNGTGFIDFVNNSGDYIQWTVSAPAAGKYDLSFRYALPAGGRPLELKVNGTVKVASLDFPATSLWDNWESVTTTQTLVAGNNTIRLTTTGSNGGNIDELSIIPYLDDCDALSNWTTASANTLTYHTADKKQGAGCLQMVGSATEEFKRSFATPINSGVSIASGVLSFWYYVSDVTKCGTVRVELGSGGAADVNELSWPLSGLENGWNYINLNTIDASQVGNPNMNALNWFRIYNPKTGSITTRIDAIRILDSASLASSQLASGKIITSLKLQSPSAAQSVSIYPNPYKEGILSIDLSGFVEAKKVNIKIVNIAGQTIYEAVHKNTSHVELNLSGKLKEAIYLIHIEAGNTQIVKKLVMN